MPTHTEKQISKFTQEQLFSIVADVEKYPEFLPWCSAARILESKDNEFLAELVISFSHISERYTSRVVLEPSNAINVTMVSGPFEHLKNTWKFTATEDGKTNIDFMLDFKFRSKILEKVIGSLFGRATEKMVNAFNRRAEALYGGK